MRCPKISRGSGYLSGSAGLTVSGGGGSGAFFQPNMASVSSLSEIFSDVNTYDGGTAVLSTALMRGSSKTVRIAYPNDEAGVELKPSPFTATDSLFVRSHEYFSEAGGSYGGAAGWATNWPVGLKTGRYFTRNDFSTGAAEPNANAYCSEKLAWQTYGGDPSDLYARGYNNAIFNLDLEGTYGSGVNFANGLPYLREGYWYKFERWYVLNSAVDAADGIMRVWIDDQLVCDRTNVVWRSTSRGCPNGSAWQSMWFGGNYSGAAFGGPSGTLHRYLTDFYLSTTLDR